jgi:predicted Na+-dependent transporter
MVDLLAALVGFALGAAMLGYAALVIGLLFLSYVPGGIHSGWSMVALFGSLICFGLGGVAGARAAVRLIKSWRD